MTHLATSALALESAQNLVVSSTLNPRSVMHFSVHFRASAITCEAVSRSLTILCGQTSSRLERSRCGARGGNRGEDSNRRESKALHGGNGVTLMMVHSTQRARSAVL